MADIMGDYGQLKAKAKADAGYESFQGHGGLKPPPGMTPEQEARWRQSVEGRVDELSAAKAKEDAERTKQRAKVAGQVAAETAVGFTPAGIVIDIKDLVSAISDRDALMLAAATIGFVPGADAVKSAVKARRRLEAVPERELVEVIERNPERLSQETRSVLFEGAPKPKKTEPLTDVDVAEATKAAADIRAGRRVSPARTRKAEVLETDEAQQLLQETSDVGEAVRREVGALRQAELQGDPLPTTTDPIPSLERTKRGGPEMIAADPPPLPSPVEASTTVRGSRVRAEDWALDRQRRQAAEEAATPSKSLDLDELGEAAAARRAAVPRLSDAEMDAELARRGLTDTPPQRLTDAEMDAELARRGIVDSAAYDPGELIKPSDLVPGPVKEAAGQAKEAAGRLSRAARDKLRGALARSPEAPAPRTPSQKIPSGEVPPARIEELRAQLYSGEAVTISPAEKEALAAANMRDFGTPGSPSMSQQKAKERLRELRNPPPPPRPPGWSGRSPKSDSDLLDLDSPPKSFNIPTTAAGGKKHTTKTDIAKREKLKKALAASVGGSVGVGVVGAAGRVGDDGRDREQELEESLAQQYREQGIDYPRALLDLDAPRPPLSDFLGPITDRNIFDSGTPPETKPAAKPAKKKGAAKKKPAKKAAPPAGSPPPVPQSMTDRYASK